MLLYVKIYDIIFQLGSPSQEDHQVWGSLSPSDPPVHTFSVEFLDMVVSALYSSFSSLWAHTVFCVRNIMVDREDTGLQDHVKHLIGSSVM